MLQARVPIYIVAGRILFVTGLSIAIAAGIFLLLGGYWQWSVLAFALALPFLALMFLIERGAGARPQTSQSGRG
jgi:membrane protein implicated in regulation of membrane protease activity